MRKIHDQEEKVLAAFKTITIKDADGKTLQVPALYANREKLESYITTTTKADGVIELKNNPLKLPVLGIEADKIQKNSIDFKGWVFATTRQDLNEIIQQIYCLEVEDYRGNNDLTIHSAKIKYIKIGQAGVMKTRNNTTQVLAAKFKATLRM